MSRQPALGLQRCLGAKKAVKLEKSLGAQQKGINSNQSWGGGWGAGFCFGFFCLFICLFSGVWVFLFLSIVLDLRKSKGLRAIQCYVEKCDFWLVVVVLPCLLQ